MEMSVLYSAGLPVKKSMHGIGEKKWKEFERMEKCILEVEKSIPEFEGEDREALQLFISEIRTNVTDVIEEAIRTEPMFGCWLRANHNFLPTVLYSLPHVKICMQDAPKVRAKKDSVLEAVELFLNCGGRND